MKPYVRIKYGKFFDTLDSEIAGDDIILDSLGEIVGEIEPGEPNTPISGTFSFELNNLDPATGDQLYPIEFWQSAARSEEEGALGELEVFFQFSWVDIDEQEHVEFCGVLSNLSYSAYNEKVTIELGDLLALLLEDKNSLLGSFHFERKSLLHVSPEIDNSSAPTWQKNDLSPVYELAVGTSVQNVTKHEMFTIEVEWRRAPYSSTNPLRNAYAIHLGYNDFAANILLDVPYYVENNAWVKIGERTVLTRIRHRFMKSSAGTISAIHTHHIQIWHLVSDNVVDEIGRFELPQGDTNEISFTIFDVNRDYSPQIILNEIDIPALNELHFFCGAPIVSHPIIESSLHFVSLEEALIDVVDVSLNALSRYLKLKLYMDPSGQPELFITRGIEQGRKAFMSDIAMFGWADLTLPEFIVALARQVSAMLFVYGSIKIVLQSRQWRISGVPLVLDEDWEPLNGPDMESGYSSFGITHPVTLRPIDNLRSSENRNIIINAAGEVIQQSLRHKTLKIQNYRVGGLSVPAISDGTGRSRIRIGPEHPSWSFSVNTSDFILEAVEQARMFAESSQYPLFNEQLCISALKYSYIQIGSIFIDEEHQDYIVLSSRFDPVTFLKNIIARPVFLPIIPDLETFASGDIDVFGTASALPILKNEAIGRIDVFGTASASLILKTFASGDIDVYGTSQAHLIET